MLIIVWNDPVTGYLVQSAPAYGDGRRFVLRPDDTDEALRERIIARYTAEGVTGMRVIETDADLPPLLGFADAWQDNGTTIQTDLAKAREIHRRRIQYAIEEEIRAGKPDTLRDILTGLDLEQFDTPLALARFWPENLPREIHWRWRANLEG